MVPSRLDTNASSSNLLSPGSLSPLGLTTMESCSVCLPDIECLPPGWSEQSLRHHQVSAAMFLQMEKVVGVGQPVASPSHMHCNKAHVLRCHPSNDQMPLRVLDTLYLTTSVPTTFVSSPLLSSDEDNPPVRASSRKARLSNNFHPSYFRCAIMTTPVR